MNNPYFWISQDDRLLNYGDGRQVRVGRTHKVEGPL